MCQHERKTPAIADPPAKNAWHLLEQNDGPTMHLYRVDALIVTLRLALDALNEEIANQDIYQLYTVCLIAEDELSTAFDQMQTILREVKVSR